MSLEQRSSGFSFLYKGVKSSGAIGGKLDVDILERIGGKGGKADKQFSLQQSNHQTPTNL
jgi:hypothetical protein